MSQVPIGADRSESRKANISEVIAENADGRRALPALLQSTSDPRQEHQPISPCSEVFVWTTTRKSRPVPDWRITTVVLFLSICRLVCPYRPAICYG